MNPMGPDFYKIYIQDLEFKKQDFRNADVVSAKDAEDLPPEIKEEIPEEGQLDEYTEHNDDLDFSIDVKDEFQEPEERDGSKKISRKLQLIRKIQRTRATIETNRLKNKKYHDIFLKHKEMIKLLSAVLKKNVRRRDGKPKDVLRSNSFEIRQGLTGVMTARKYSKDLKAFAVSLKAISHKSYVYVKEVFEPCLPGPKTVTRWGRMFNVMDDVDGKSKKAIESGDSD